MNLHASAIVVGDKGVLVTGPSGSGKTLLALSLIGHFRASGLFARLVSDDQVVLAARSGRLACRAPETIAGLAEARGTGPSPVNHLPSAVIDLLVELVEGTKAPRMAPDESRLILGITMPLLILGERNVGANVLAIAAALGFPPFAGGAANRQR